MSVTRVTDRTYLIDTLALGRTRVVAAYVIKAQKTTLVDCGYASSYTNVMEGLTEIGIDPLDVRYVVPTHVHLDHAGGAGYLVRKMPRAEVVAHEKAVPHLVDPSRLVESATGVFGAERIKRYGLPVPIESAKIIPVREEMHLELGGESLVLLHTPGHAPHQISAYAEGERLIIAGDAVGIVYPAVPTLIPITPPPSLEPQKLHESLGKLGALDAKRLLVPHFGVRDDVSDMLELTGSKTDSWISKARTLKEDGATPEQAIASFGEEIASESGIKREDLPEPAQDTIRISTMGLLQYLGRKP